jgi:hypothetical protein
MSEINIEEFRNLYNDKKENLNKYPLYKKITETGVPIILVMIITIGIYVLTIAFISTFIHNDIIKEGIFFSLFGLIAILYLKLIETFFPLSGEKEIIPFLIYRIANKIKTQKDEEDKKSIISDLKLWNNMELFNPISYPHNLFETSLAHIDLFQKEMKELPKRIYASLSLGKTINSKLLEELAYSLYVHNEDSLKSSSHTLYKDCPQTKEFKSFKLSKFMEPVKPWYGIIIYSIIILSIICYLHVNLIKSLPASAAILAIFLSPVAKKVVDSIKK